MAGNLARIPDLPGTRPIGPYRRPAQPSAGARRAAEVGVGTHDYAWRRAGGTGRSGGAALRRARGDRARSSSGRDRPAQRLSRAGWRHRHQHASDDGGRPRRAGGAIRRLGGAARAGGRAAGARCADGRPGQLWGDPRAASAGCRRPDRRRFGCLGRGEPRRGRQGGPGGRGAPGGGDHPERRRRGCSGGAGCRAARRFAGRRRVGGSGEGGPGASPHYRAAPGPFRGGSRRCGRARSGRDSRRARGRGDRRGGRAATGDRRGRADGRPGG